MVIDHSARHGGAMRSMSLRNGRDVLIKSVSSAYSTSSGKEGSFKVNSEQYRAEAVSLRCAYIRCKCHYFIMFGFLEPENMEVEPK